MSRNVLPNVDRVLLWTTLGLVVVGLFALSTASSVLAYQRYDNNYYFFLRQFMFGVVPGMIFLYFFSRFDYKKLQNLAPLFVLAGIGMLVAVLIPGIGFEVGGASRWINFGAFLFQPAEFVKLAMLLYLASWYDKRQHHVHDLYYGYLPVLAIVGLTAGLIILQPDIGTMLILASIAAVMLFVGGARFKYLLSTAGVGLLIMWLLVKAAPYRAQRFLAFFDPSVDTQGISYQINQALIAIGSGGWWGVGFGQSRQKYSYLPEPMGDSIFAILSEELGFVRILFVLALFALFATDTFGKLVAAGITAWIVIQSFINIGAITGLIPLTGVPLPFISYGSTSLAITLAAVGILLNISRYSER
jgi:cell division protein FtsW